MTRVEPSRSLQSARVGTALHLCVSVCVCVCECVSVRVGEQVPNGSSTAFVVVAPLSALGGGRGEKRGEKYNTAAESAPRGLLLSLAAELDGILLADDAALLPPEQALGERGGGARVERIGDGEEPVRVLVVALQLGILAVELDVAAARPDCSVACCIGHARS
jgi:hypothetical protein